MEYFTLSDLVQVLEDTMTHEEIEIFLSNEWDSIMIMNPEFHFIVALFLSFYIQLEIVWTVIFFQTFDRIVWRSTQV